MLNQSGQKNQANDETKKRGACPTKERVLVGIMPSIQKFANKVIKHVESLSGQSANQQRSLRNSYLANVTAAKFLHDAIRLVDLDHGFHDAVDVD